MQRLLRLLLLGLGSGLSAGHLLDLFLQFQGVGIGRVFGDRNGGKAGQHEHEQQQWHGHGTHYLQGFSALMEAHHSKCLA
jgi:hypothetical protein